MQSGDRCGYVFDAVAIEAVVIEAVVIEAVVIEAVVAPEGMAA